MFIAMLYILPNVQYAMRARGLGPNHVGGAFSDGEVFFLPNFLDSEISGEMRRKMLDVLPELDRMSHRSGNFMRKGLSISQADKSSKDVDSIFKVLDAPETTSKIATRTPLRVEFVPRTDANRLSLLMYLREGDGMEWHFDGNNYYGERWVGLYTILNRDGNGSKPSSVELVIRSANSHRELALPTTENSLLLFRGDKHFHKVTRALEGDRRVVASMLFCDVCERKLNPLAHLYQMGVNLSFYGNI